MDGMADWARSERLRWGEIRDQAIAAVEADIAAIERNGKGKRLTGKPVRVPPAGRPLAVRVVDDMFWKDKVLYVVDADLQGEAAEDRHPVKFAGFAVNEVLLRLPQATRAELKDVHSVHVYRIDDIELRLKRALLKHLSDAAAGHLVEDLWNARGSGPPEPGASPPATQRVDDIAQRQALAAMTAPGGWFVWGPPGTGKTTVITEAVRDALANGRSVLIASHTHVAVDNVIEGVIDPASGIEYSCGDVIRLASESTFDSVSAKVRKHDHLLIGKATAVINKTVERRKALHREKEANQSNPARARLTAQLEALADVDGGAIERARQTVQTFDELRRLETHHQATEDQLARLRVRIDAHEQAARSLGVHEDERDDAAGLVRRSDEALAAAVRSVEAAQESLRACEAERDAIASQLVSSRTAATAPIARALPPLRAVRNRRMRAVEADHLAAARSTEEAATLLAQTTSHQARCRDAAVQATAAVEALEDRSRRASEERASAHQLAREGAELTDHLTEQAGDMAELRELTTGMSQARARSVLDEAAEHGWLDMLDALSECRAHVDALDEELEAISVAERTIKSEEMDTRRRLLREANVVACTLATYVLQPSDLIDRRFDVVILDEASSIEPAPIALAGSRAKRTFVVVGDFLQNAPINEVDETASDDPERLAWRTADIFALAGIVDHDSAMTHQRCVALRTQFRFPPIIADAVNAFCYGGMLQSGRQWVADDGAVITMVTTSGHHLMPLQADGRSWWNELGLKLLETIALDPKLQVGSTFGFITPYRAQADHARKRQLQTASGLAVACGTAHAFQGRQYDTVVVDLMQDNRLRWVGHADLRGNKHAVAAAKLLNVALTRTRRRLYLIGDWDFIRSCSSPGMQALATLDGHPDFTVIEAADLLVA